MIEVSILFENSQILILNKPARLVTIPGPGHAFRDSLAGWVRKYVGEEILKVGEESRWGIVHRLDKDTSGVLVIAKTSKAYQHLKEQFRERKIKKVYWALVWGKPEEDGFVVDVPLTRHPRNWARFTVANRDANKSSNGIANDANSNRDANGRKGSMIIANREANNRKVKEARTEFRVIRKGVKLPISPGRTRLPETFTLLECRPVTGRTHQIRVHLKHAGYPIVGDLYYSGRRKYRAVKEFLTRQFLHAKSIRFELLDGTIGEFEAELPEELGVLLPVL